LCPKTGLSKDEVLCTKVEKLVTKFQDEAEIPLRKNEVLNALK
jgi:hypothetical protein